GGSSWTQLTNVNLINESFTSVAARGSILLAASDNTNSGNGNGLFRSINSGSSFTLISGGGGTGLPTGSVTDLVGDPFSSNILYAAVKGANAGIFRSTDTGATWTNITSGVTALSNTSVKAEMSVYDD